MLNAETCYHQMHSSCAYNADFLEVGLNQAWSGVLASHSSAGCNEGVESKQKQAGDKRLRWKSVMVKCHEQSAGQGQGWKAKAE